MSILPNISPELLKAYETEIAKRNSPVTAKRKMSSLKRFFNWAHKEGHVEQNPIQSPSQTVQQPPVTQEVQQVVEPEPAKRKPLSTILFRGFVVIGMAILIFLLVSKTQLPIPFIPAPATNEEITEIEPTVEQAVLLSPWTIITKMNLRDSEGNPTVGPQTITFKLYKSEDDNQSFWSSGAKQLTPDADGSILISLEDVPAELFFENEKLYLAAETVQGELGSRLPVSTANVSANLQGYYPAEPEEGAFPNTIPVISENGELLLATEAPAIKATEGNLLIEGQTVTISTPTASDGDITINPDGAGIAHFLFEGTSSNFLNAQAPNLISGSLYYGIVANNATGYDLIKLQSGSSPVTRFSVDALGNTQIGGELNVEGDVSTKDTIRITSEGALTNITGYQQTSGNFSITQTGGETATISKINTTALSDLLTLTLDERGKPATSDSIYSTLTLKRYDGAIEAMALLVDEGNAQFDGQVRLGRFTTNPDSIGTGSLIYNTGDDNLYYYTASGWTQISTGGGASVWQRISGILSPLASTDDLAIGGTDSTAPFFVNDSGTITFSSDTNLYRSATDTLATDDSLTVGSNLAVNGGNITSTGTLTLNATSTVIIPDADTFQTNDITHSGTITIDSGGTVQLGTDDDFLPQLGAALADIGASGTRWDNIYAVAGDFSGTVTAYDFSCTDCLDFAEFANNMTLDEATDIALGSLTLSTSGTGALDFNSTGQVSFAGNVDAESGLDVTGANLTVGSSSEFSVDVSTGNITTAGDLAVNGGDITSTASTFNIVNSGVSILNIGGAASTISIGASSGTTTINDDLAVSGGDITGANGAALDLGEANSGDLTVTGDLLPVDDDTYDLGSGSLRWQDMYVVNLNVSSTNIAGTTSETFTIDTDDTGGDLSYIFGTTLNESLTWDASSDGDTGISGMNQFELTDTLGIAGNLIIGDGIIANGQGLLEVNRAATISALIATDVPLTVQGTSDQTANLAEFQKPAGTNVATLSPTGNLAIEGTLSDLTDSTLTIDDALSILGTILTIGNGSAATIQTTDAILTLDSGTANSVSLGASDDFSIPGADITGANSIKIDLGEANSTAITVTGHVFPEDNNTYDLGSDSLRWATIYTNEFCLSGTCETTFNNLGPWELSDPYLYPDSANYQVGIGITNTADIISKLYVTNDGDLTGKAVAVFNQTELEDILTASASGTPRLTITRTGNLQFHQASTITTTTGNLTIDTAGILVISDVADLNNQLDLDISSTTALTAGDGSADTFTVDTASDIITIAGQINQTGSGQVTFSGNVDATSGLDVTGANLTVGSSSEFSVDVSTGNITTAGDLAVNGGNITSTGALDISSGGSGILSLDSDSGILTLGAGTNTIANTDVSTNITLDPTAALKIADSNTDPRLILGIKSDSSSDPTGTEGATYYNSTSGKFRCYENGSWADCIPELSTAGGWTDEGTIVRLTSVDDQVGIGTATPVGKLHITTTSNLLGKASLVVNQVEDQDILTASASGTAKLILTKTGELQTSDLTLGLDDTSATISTYNTNENLTIDPDGTGTIYFHGTSYQISDSGNLTLGGRITFENSEYIANETDDIIAFVGASGTDNTDLYLNLDGTYPVLYSNTDTKIGIDDDLEFVGAQSITTSADNLTLSPAGNLVIDSTGDTLDIDDPTVDLSSQATNFNLIDANTGALTFETDLFRLDTSNTAVEVTGTTNLGDGGTANYAQFSSTGDLSFIGTADTITGPGSNGLTATNAEGQIQLITTTTGEIDITSAELIDINAGANLDIDITGTYDMLASSTFSIAGTGNSSITATSGNLTLTTATAGDVYLGPPVSLATTDDLYFQDGTLTAAIPLTETDTALQTPTDAIIDAINEAYNAAIGGVGGVWTRDAGTGTVYPATISDKVGIGTTTPTDIISKLFVTGNSTLTGKSVAIFVQTEDEDILTASASGNTRLRLTNAGDLSFSGDLTVTGNNIAGSGGTVITFSGTDASFAADITVTGGDITGANGAAIDIGEATSGDITFTGDLIVSSGSFLGLGSGAGRFTFTDATPDVIDVEAANLDINANSLVGSTAAIDFTNFDVSTAGEITIAAGTGLDTNAAGTLDIGVTNANAISISKSGVTTTVNGALTVTEAFTANGDVTLGNAITDNITFTGRVAQDSDLIPITTTGTNDLGSSSLIWDNLYIDQICFDGGSDCITNSDSSGPWTLSSNYLYPDSENYQVGIGTTNTADIISKLYVSNTGTLTGKSVAIFVQTEDEDILTASASSTTRLTLNNDGQLALPTQGSTGGLLLGGDAALYRGASDRLTSPDSADFAGSLRVGSAGVPSDALDVDGTANISGAVTLGSTLTLPNSNTLTGISTSYTQFSAGISVGGATTHYFDSSGNLNANQGTFADTLTANALFDANGQVDLGDGGDTITLSGTTVSLTSNGGGNDITITAADDIIFDDGTTTGGIAFTLDDAALSTPTNAIIDAINEAYAAGSGSGGGVWALDSGTIYPASINNEVGIGTTTPANIISKLYVTNDGDLTGKSVAIFVQTEDEDILTASASGTTRLKLTNAGDLSFSGDLTVEGNDIQDSGDNVIFSFDGSGNIDSLATIATTITQSGANQVTFTGNVDAQSGLDVTNASLTVGGSYSWTTGGVISAATDETINGIDISAGNVTDVVNLTASGTITFSGLTASRAVFTNGSSQLVSSATSLVLKNSITDETGSGVLVFATSPTFTTDITTPSILSADDLTINPTGGDVNLGSGDNLNLTASTDLFFGSTSLGETTGAANSGAYIVGAFDEFDYSTQTNVQGVLNDLDAKIGDIIGGSAGLWTLNGSDLYATDIDYKVGIGTTSPTGRLHVATNTTTLTGKSALIVDQLENEDIFTASASGSPKFVIDNSGNVGIGTTSPTWGTLAVVGDIRSGTDATNYGGMAWSAGLNITTYNYATPVKIDGSNILLQTNASGNVGIGTTTPLAKLQITKTNSGSITTGLYMKNATAVNGGIGIDFDNTSSDSVSARINSLRTGAGDYETALVFSTDPGSGTVTEKLRIEGDGNVGIGTTSPGAKLHVSGSNEILRLQNPSSGGTVEATLLFETYTHGGNSKITGSSVPSSSYQGNLQLQTRHNDQSWNTGLLIDTIGNVGIGTTGPDAPLDVLSTGGEQLRLTFADGSTYTSFNTDTNGDLTIDASGGDVTLGSGDNLNLTASTDLFFGSTSLGETTSAVDSGAYVVGAFDEFDYSTQTNVQGVLNDLDSKIGDIIGGSAGLWTVSGDLVYLTDTADDLVIGGSTLASAFSVDVSGNTVRIGSGATANAVLNMYASDGDTGSLTYTTNDAWAFEGGNVGIGTTAPAKQLHIVSATSPEIRVEDTTNTTIAILRATNTTADMGANTSGHATRILAGGAVAIQIDSGGNVGIGDTTPGSLLELLGSQPASVGTTPGTAATDIFTLTGGTGGDTSIATTGVGGIGADLALTGGVGGVANSALTSSTGGVGGSFTFTAGAGGASAVTSGTAGTGGVGGSITLSAGTGGVATLATTTTGGAGGTLTLSGGIGGAGTTTAGTGGPIIFQTATTTSLAEAMRIDKDGNVGIGTTGPGAELHVQDDSGDAVIRVGETSSIVGNMYWDYSDNIFRFDTQSNNYPIRLDGSAVYLMPSGNVGIGTTSPGAPLHLYKNTDVASTGPTGSFMIGDVTNGTYLAFDDNEIQAFVSDAASSGILYLQIDGGSARLFNSTAGTLYVNSDDLYVASNQVGIGTTNPGYTLDVSGQGRFTSYINLSGTDTTATIRQVTSDGSDTGRVSIVGGGDLSTSRGAYIMLHGNEHASSPGELILRSGAVNADITFTPAGTGDSIFSSGYVGIGTTGPDAGLDSLATSGEQLRLTYTDGSVYTGFTVSSGGDLTIDATGGDVTLGSGDNLNLTASTDLFFGSTSLGETTSAVDSGAYIVGAFDEFDYSTETNVQGVLDDLDAKIGDIIGGTAGLWTDSGTITYLTSTADDLAVGGSTLASAFSVDVGLNTVRIGTGATANAVLNMYASDGDTGSLTYTTNDSWAFENGNVGIGTTAPDYKLHVVAPSGSGNVTKFTTNDWVTSTTGSSLNLTFGASSGNTFSKITALDAGGSSVADLILQHGSGSVGIGTTTPSGILQIVGDEVRIGDAGSVDYATGDGDLYIEDQLEVDGDAYHTGDIYFGVVDNASIQKGTLLAMSQSGGNYNVLGFSENRLTRADEKYTVTVSPACDTGSSTSIFDNKGSSSCLYTSWSDGVDTSVITIDMVGTGTPLHYWSNLSINMPFSRRVSGVKVEKYYDIDSGDGWSCNEGDNAWSTVYEDTSNTLNDIDVKSSLGNGICRFRITFSGTANTAGYLSIGEISAQQYFYGPDGGGFIASTGDTMYGSLIIGTTSTNRNLTVTGDVAVNGGDITSTLSTFNLINVTTETLNIGGAATAVSLGAATGTTTINNTNTVITGNLDVNGSTNDIAGTLNLSGGTLTSTDDLTINPTGGDVNLGSGDNLNLTASTDLFFGSTSLGETTSAVDSGAYIVGAFDEFVYSDEVNVQGVLDDLDAKIGDIIGGSAGLWTDSGSITYLTSTADDLAVGGSTLASAFSVDVSGNTVRIGSGATANAVLNMYASDGDTGSLTYTTNDSWAFEGGNVGIGTTAPGVKLEVAGTTRFAYASNPDLYYLDLAPVYDGVPGEVNYRFSIKDGASTADVITIMEAGDVGIGTTAPTEKLHVAGNAKFDYPILGQGDSVTRTFTNVAHYSYDSGSQTGYAIIQTNIPQDSSTMLQVDVNFISNYNDGNKSPCRITIGGYWTTEANAGFRGLGQTNTCGDKVQVQIGRQISDGDSAIILGVVGTTWSYPKITVSRVLAGYTISDTYADGWTISISTDISGYTNFDTVPDKTTIAASSITSGTFGSGDYTFPGDLTISGDDLYMATNTANYFLMADGTNYNPVTPASARTGLGLVAAGAGDIWVEKAGDTMTGDLTVGSTGRTANTYVRALAGDAYIAGFEAYGASQGTGYAYVGQSATHGGGIFYNGDGSPAFATGESADRISFYRRNASVNEVVFSYPYSSNAVTFRGDLTISGDDLYMATNTANYFLMADGTNYNPVSPASARTGLGITAGGTGDIWVEKAGDTMTGPLVMNSTYLNINRAGSTDTGIQWYNNTFNAWAEYMASNGQTGVGPRGTLTAPSGNLVTSWGLRSFIENNAGYGWTFESGTSGQTTPTIVAEIRSSDGSMQLDGDLTVSGGDITGANNIQIRPGSTNNILRLEDTSVLSANDAKRLDIIFDGGYLQLAATDYEGDAELMQIPNGLYVSGGTFYASNMASLRGGWRDDENEDVNQESQQGMGFMIDYNNDNADTEYFRWAKNGTGFTGGSELMRLTESGSLGIGTTAPGALLQVGSGTDAKGCTDCELYITRAGDAGIAVRDSTNNVETRLYAANWGGMVGTGTNHKFFIRTNDTDRMTLDTTGYVGIRDTTPSVQLNIGPNNTNHSLGADDLLVSDDVEIDGILYLDSNVVHNSAGTLTLTLSGTNDLTVAGDLTVSGTGNSSFAGNVGIGTTAPLSKLGVVGGLIHTADTNTRFGAQISGDDSGIGLFGSNLYVDSSDNLKTFGTHGSYGYAGIEAAWGDLKFYAESGATTQDATVTPAAKMTILDTGQVGIGIGAPSDILEIGSNTDTDVVLFQAGTTDSPSFQFRRSRGTLAAPTSLSTNDNSGTIGALPWNSGTSSYGLQGSLQFYADGTHGSNDTPIGIIFSTTPDGSATIAEAMRILGNGNVGIGTTAPDTILELNTTDNALTIDFQHAKYAIQFDRSGTNIGNIYKNTSGPLVFQSLANGSTTNDFTFSEGDVSISSTASGPVFAANARGLDIRGTGGRVNNPQDGTERIPTLRITDTITDYGSATATIGEKRGAIEFYSNEATGNYPAIAAAIYVVNEDTYNTAHGLAFYTNYIATTPTERMRIDSGGDVTIDALGAGDVYADANGKLYIASDRSLKENISPIENALDKVLQLQGVYYDWTEDSGIDTPTQVGFIANDVAETIPELTGERKDGLKTMYYGRTTALLVEAIKEQQAQITNLAETLFTNIEAGAITAKEIFIEGGLTVADKIIAGAIESQEIVTDSFFAFQGTIDNLLITGGLVSPVIETEMISPIAGSDLTIDLDNSAPEATESSFGRLVVKGEGGTEVASIDAEGNATFSGTLESEEVKTKELVADRIYVDEIISKSSPSEESPITIEQIEELLRQSQEDQELLADATDSNIFTATDSASLEELVLGQLYVTGQAAINALSVSFSLTVGSDFVVQSLTDESGIITNSLDTLTAPFKLQSLAMAPLEIMAGKVRIDTEGNVEIAGNLYVAGQIESSGLTLKDNESENNSSFGNLLSLVDTEGIEVASIDASGAAQFASVATNKLIIASSDPSLLEPNIYGEIETNATAGKAVIPAGTTEIIIINPNVGDYTLVYVTPTSSTLNKVLYVKSKQKGSFTVGFNNSLSIDVDFNWWVIDVAE